MLRSLTGVSNDNPNGTGPKSAKFRPTPEEAKEFSKEELAYVERTEEEDREFRANRALRAQRVDSLLEIDDAINERKRGK